MKLKWITPQPRDKNGLSELDNQTLNTEGNTVEIPEMVKGIQTVLVSVNFIHDYLL